MLDHFRTFALQCADVRPKSMQYFVTTRAAADAVFDTAQPNADPNRATVVMVATGEFTGWRHPPRVAPPKGDVVFHIETPDGRDQVYGLSLAISDVSPPGEAHAIEF